MSLVASRASCRRRDYDRTTGRTLRKLHDDALALPEQDRLALAAELIDSVEGPEDPTWTAAWSA